MTRVTQYFVCVRIHPVGSVPQKVRRFEPKEGRVAVYFRRSTFAHSHTNLSDVLQVIKKETSPVLHAPQAYVLPCHKCAQLVTFVCKWAETWPTALPSECLDLRFSACLPFTRANRSVYRLGRFGQMVGKFSYWENSVRDWHLPFAEIPTIDQKICTTAMANHRTPKHNIWIWLKMKLWIYEIHIFELRNEEIKCKEDPRSYYPASLIFSGFLFATA